ncbi:MAG: hypothetical protein ABIJ09_21650 [Pseudomonadota bacterium]
MTSREARTLLARQRIPIACAVARQIQQTVPSYQAIDGIQLARGVSNVLDAVVRLLDGGDYRVLMDVLDVLKKQRHEQGFKDSDFLVAVLCGLPVIRRFFLNHASALRTGLALFEEVERVLLPLYGYLAQSDVRAFEEMATAPDTRKPAVMAGRAEGGTLIDFEIATVDEAVNQQWTRPYIERYGEG